MERTNLKACRTSYTNRRGFAWLVLFFLLILLQKTMNHQDLRQILRQILFLSWNKRSVATNEWKYWGILLRGASKRTIFASRKQNWGPQSDQKFKIIEVRMIMFLIMAIATVLLMVLVSVGVYIGMKQSEKQECEDRITDCEEMQISSSMCLRPVPVPIR